MIILIAIIRPGSKTLMAVENPSTKFQGFLNTYRNIAAERFQRTGKNGIRLTEYIWTLQMEKWEEWPSEKALSCKHRVIQEYTEACLECHQNLWDLGRKQCFARIEGQPPKVVDEDTVLEIVRQWAEGRIEPKSGDVLTVKYGNWGTSKFLVKTVGPQFIYGKRWIENSGWWVKSRITRDKIICKVR